MSNTTDNTEIVIVPANYLFAISLYQAKSDVRYYLNGIALLPYRQHVTGTDGHTLCIARLENDKFWWNHAGQEKPDTVKEPHWIIGSASGDSKGLQLEKPKTKEVWAVIRIDTDTKRGLIQYCEYENRDFVIDASKDNTLPTTQVFSFQIVDGKYPDYERIKPDYSRPIEDTLATINVDYMLRIGNTAKALSSEKYLPIAIHYPINNNLCSEVEIAGFPDLQIIFMQIKNNKRFKAKAILPINGNTIERSNIA